MKVVIDLSTDDHTLLSDLVDIVGLNQRDETASCLIMLLVAINRYQYLPKDYYDIFFESGDMDSQLYAEVLDLLDPINELLSAKLEAKSNA